MATFKNQIEFMQALADGLVTREKCPNEELWIVNYSRKAVHDPNNIVNGTPWHSETLRQCRGLIIDEHLNFVSRPFEKFFNFEELFDLPHGIIPEETFKLPYTISEKIDGSLGIMYWTKDGPALATRSTFTSEQALHGTKILREKYGEIANALPQNKTFLFEIVYPENRLVVDYGDTEDLFLLAVIDTETGIEEDADQYHGFQRPQQFPGEWQTIRQQYVNLGNDKNREGFVVRFANGVRLKLKFRSYFMLHYLKGKMNRKNIIQYLSGNEESKKEFKLIYSKIEKLDEEVAAFVDNEIREINELKNQYLENARQLVKYPNEFNSMKDWSEYVKAQGQLAPVIFRLIKISQSENECDNAALEHELWRLVASNT